MRICLSHYIVKSFLSFPREPTLFALPCSLINCYDVAEGRKGPRRRRFDASGFKRPDRGIETVRFDIELFDVDFAI